MNEIYLVCPNHKTTTHLLYMRLRFQVVIIFMSLIETSAVQNVLDLRVNIAPGE